MSNNNTPPPSLGQITQAIVNSSNGLFAQAMQQAQQARSYQQQLSPASTVTPFFQSATNPSMGLQRAEVETLVGKAVADLLYQQNLAFGLDVVSIDLKAGTVTLGKR